MFSLKPTYIGCSTFQRAFAVGVLMTALCTSGWPADAAPSQKCLIFEIYYRGSVNSDVQAANLITDVADKTPGFTIRAYDLDRQNVRQRLEAIRSYFRLNDKTLPLIYGCNGVVLGNLPLENVAAQVESLRTMEVYVRSGCPHCRDAKQFLPSFAKRYPGLKIRIFDIVTDTEARNRLQQLASQYRTAAASVPVFHFCRQLVVGFSSAETTGGRLDQILTQWTYACPAVTPRPSEGAMIPSSAALTLISVVNGHGNLWNIATTGLILESEESPPPPLPLPPKPADGELPPPLGVPPPIAPPPMSDEGTAANSPLPSESPQPEDTIELPFLGTVSATRLGIVMFTVVVGLVDGFNPCAMWVLLILLSVLVNLRSRKKILAVAGTFVVISGVAYFAFMAAWLNVFLLVGFLRPVQIVLSLIAITVGSIHIKDFFAFKQGISLSIPDSAKPGIYSRIHRILTAKSLWAAIAAASVLAVLVNIVELLCTAGLPALYTQILTMQQFPAWQNYLYLILYNVAYMFDDGLMVAIVVITLGSHRMQEHHGRWLKLISGIVVLAIGVLLLVSPEVLY